MSFSRSIFEKDDFNRTYQKFKRLSQKRSDVKQTPKKLLEDHLVNVMKVSTMRQKGPSEKGLNLNYKSSFKFPKRNIDDLLDDFSRGPTTNTLLVEETSRRSNFPSKLSSSGRGISRSRSHKKYQQVLDELGSPSLSSKKGFGSKQDDPFFTYSYGKKKLGGETGYAGKVQSSGLMNEFSSKRESVAGYKKELMRPEVNRLQLYLETMTDKEFNELPASYVGKLTKLAQTIMLRNKSTLASFK